MDCEERWHHRGSAGTLRSLFARRRIYVARHFSYGLGDRFDSARTRCQAASAYYGALGKIAAHIASGAVVLAIATAILALKADLSRECSHVHSPILPTPREEAEAMYKVYMEDPQSPPELKNVRKATVIRILTQRARDHYQTIPTNGVARWQFFAADKREGWTQPTTDAKIRFRFTNMHDTRQDIKGTVRWGSLVGEFSSMTRSFVEVPFKEGALENASPDDGEITVRNTGSGPLMLRQRQDVHLLLPARMILSVR